MKRAITIVAFVVLCSALAAARTYTTTFTGTENPLTESGNWINGGVVGLDWHNCRKTPGQAFGTQPGTVSFDDSTCLLAGPWGPDQTVRLTVRIPGSNTSASFEEVEVRLRSTITAHSNTGYEINCSVRSGQSYMQIIRWDGALGAFTNLNAATTLCQDGDILEGKVVGNLLTATRFASNGTTVLATVSVTNATYTTGAPGIGFYIQNVTGTAAAANAEFGASALNATDGIATKLWSNLIADSRAIDWTQAGVAGGIPSATWTQCGALMACSSTAAQINTRINSCGANQFVLLDACTFNLNDGLLWSAKNNVALRGAGADATLLIFTGSKPCSGSPSAPICFMSTDGNYFGSPSNIANWTAGYARNTTSITLSALTTGSHPPTVGEFLTLDQTDDVCGTITGGVCAGDNSSIFVCYTPLGQCSGNGDNGGAPRAGRSQQQIVTITSVSGTGPYTVGISPGLAMPNWSSGKAPQAWWATSPEMNAGVENLSINSISAASNHSITFFNCQNCWAKGVRSVGPTGRSHVIAWQSTHITVQDSYFYRTNDSASVNYGIESLPASYMLVQNNIFEQIQAPYPANGTCTGCVFAYNFDVNNVFTSLVFQNQSGFAHAVGDDFMLYEGNIGSGFASDNFHGTHHLITNFRNYWNGYQLNEGSLPNQATTPLIMKAYSRFYNAIGNVLGNPARHTTYSTLYDIGSGAGIPADPQTGITLMRWGNYANCSGASPCSTSNFDSTEVPSGLTGTQAPFANAVPVQTLPASFYLAAQPAWWPSGKPWPTVGPDISGGNVKYCVGGAQTGTYVLNSGQCPGGTATTLAGGRILSNPAMDCYLSTLGGAPDGQGAVLTFNANLCYAAGVAPAVTLTPSALTFSALLVGLTSASQPLTLTNTGTATLTISSIVASGDFAQSNTCGATLSIGLSCTINVTFSPTNSGARTGAITVTDNASGSPHSSALSGTGIVPTIYRPTTFTDSGVNPVVNPTFAYDADLTTFATGTADDPAGTVHPYTIVYSGFPATIGTPLYAAIYLYNASYNLGCSLGGEQAEYSLDGGSTWSQAWVGRTHGAQNAPLLDRVILSPGQQFSQVQVRFGFGSGGTPTGCSLVTQMYEVWIQIGAPTSTFQGGNLFQGGNVLQ